MRRALLMVMLALLGLADAWQSPASLVRLANARVRPASARVRHRSTCSMTEEPPKDDEPTNLSDKLNSLLDTQFFDPTEDSKYNEPAPLREFKNLWNSDQGMAEAVYAGGVFAILIFFSQQGVRVYKHCYFMPDAQCPWNVEPADVFAIF